MATYRFDDLTDEKIDSLREKYKIKTKGEVIRRAITLLFAVDKIMDKDDTKGTQKVSRTGGKETEILVW